MQNRSYSGTERATLIFKLSNNDIKGKFTNIKQKEAFYL
jgi:hypothetical protein